MAPGPNTSPAAPARTALIVLGMHRSGTSVLTRVLSLMGADLPASLMGPSPNNPTGYWESHVVRDFNDRLLAVIGSYWDDWRALPEGWDRSPKVAEFTDEAAELLETEFGTSGFLVLKDPRVSRLMPFWDQVLRAQGLVPRPVLSLRHPMEVAASLAQRNDFAPELSYLLWLRYMLDAERASRGQARVVVSYETVMNNWASAVERVTQGLDLVWPRGPAQISAEVGALISPDHRHHVRDKALLDSPLVSDWLRDAYAIFQSWAQDQERSEDHDRLDAIRADLDAAGATFAPLIDDMRATKAELTKRLGVIKDNQARIKELAEFKRKSEAQSEKATIQAQVIQSLKQEIEVEAKRTDTAVQKAKADLQATSDAEIAALREKLEAQATALHAQDTRIGSLQDDLARAEETAETQASKLAETQSALAQKEAELNDTRQDLQRATTAQQKAEQHAKTLDHVNQSLKREADLEHAHVQSLTRENRALHKSVTAAEDTIAQLRADHDREIGGLRAELAEITARADTRHSELAQLSNLLMQAEADSQQTQAERQKLQTEHDALQSERDVLHAEHHALHAEHDALHAEHNALHAEHDALHAQFQQLGQDRQAVEDALAKSQESLHEVSTHRDDAARAADQARTDIATLRAAQADLTAVVALLQPLRHARFWRRGRTQQHREIEAVRRSGLFDADWYLRCNPDVGDTGMDPLTHFVLYGLAEGRAPREPKPNPKHVMPAERPQGAPQEPPKEPQ